MQSATYLLVLPKVVSVRKEDIHAYYTPPIAKVFSQLVSSPNQDRSITALEIACVLPSVKQDAHGSTRARSFNLAQHLLSSLYNVVLSISATRGIDLNGPRGLDVAIYFVNAVESDDKEGEDRRTGMKVIPSGPVISLQALVLSRRQWKDVFVPKYPESQFLLSRLAALKRASGESEPFPWSVREIELDEQESSTTVETPLWEDAALDDVQARRRHACVAVGGTFDHLHIGHKLLLTMTAFLLDPLKPDAAPPRRLIVGITGDALLKKKKYAERLWSWSDRRAAVARFLETTLDFYPSIEIKSHEGGFDLNLHNQRMQRLGLEVEYAELHDPYGPTITDGLVSGLVVSAETRSGGAAINEKRLEAKFDPLDVFEVDVLDSSNASAPATEFAAKISSTDVRRLEAERAQSDG